MADEIDIANATLHLEMDTLLTHRVIYAGPSASFCDECGEPIPTARRDAVPGCSLCIDCAEELEREAGLHHRGTLYATYAEGLDGLPA